MKEGFDVGLEMCGNPAAFRDMLDNMSHGAKIAMLGIPAKEMAIQWRQVIFNMLTIKGIYGREMYETWYKMTVNAQSGLDITPVITHRFPYTEFQKGLKQCAPANRERSYSTGLLRNPGRFLHINWNLQDANIGGDLSQAAKDRASKPAGE